MAPPATFRVSISAQKSVEIRKETIRILKLKKKSPGIMKYFNSVLSRNHYPYLLGEKCISCTSVCVYWTKEAETPQAWNEKITWNRYIGRK